MAKKVSTTKKTTTTKKVAKKKESKNEIIKKLQNPNLSGAEKGRLMEKLYEGIEFKK